MRIHVRMIYVLVGFLVFLICGWGMVTVSGDAADNPTQKFASLPLNVWVGVLGSIAASGIFFTVVELLRWPFDEAVGNAFRRVKYFEQSLGISHVFKQKGDSEAKTDYKKAIAEAKRRVWAFGVSNGEFVNDNFDAIVSAKKRHPKLDVQICFVDPDVEVIDASKNRKSLVYIYDTTKNKNNESDQSQRVKENAKRLIHRFSESKVEAKVRYISSSGYISGMVIDDFLYFFPYVAVEQDNTTTPYMKIHANSELGTPFISFLEHLIDHPKFSREAS